MLHITDKVVAAGRLADVIAMASVVHMFSVVAKKFGGGGKKFTEEMAHNCAGDPKETLKWWQWGKCCFSL